jgi:hypothetical protein
MGGLIAAGISLVTSVVNGWSERRRVKAETKMRIEEARANAEIARLQRMAEAEIDWDTEAMRQRRYTYVDEAWTCATLFLLAGCFIPELQPYMEKGFEALKKAPWWVELAVVGQIVAAFGLRWLFKEFINRFKK